MVKHSITAIASIGLFIFVTWLILVISLVFARPSNSVLVDIRRLIPDIATFTRSLFRDKAIQRHHRIRLALLLAYLVMPFDVIPDFLPVIGIADDVIIIVLVLRSVLKGLEVETINKHWKGSVHNLAILMKMYN